MVALASCPGSGNTWLRHLLQEATSKPSYHRGVTGIVIVIMTRNKFHNYTTSKLTYFYVSTTIGGLLQELNVQWSLLARWRGEQTVPHVTYSVVTTEHSFPEKVADGSRNVEVSRIASCVIMKKNSNNILTT